jgi:hypothetical protein
MESCGGVLNVILRVRLERYRSNVMIGISIAVLVGNDIPKRVALSAEVLCHGHDGQVAVVYLYQSMV